VLPDLQAKVIVFAHHRIMLDTIEDACKATKKTYMRIDGDTPQKKRASMVEEFKTTGDVAILSIAACGMGLNFTMCSHMIFAELRWNPGELLQAEDRCHRIGQTADSLLIQYLLADGSLDNYVWKKVKSKFGVLDTVLNDQNRDGFQAETTELEVDRDDDFLEVLDACVAYAGHTSIISRCEGPPRKKKRTL
jgi:SNF2 family DNA or RNA helicase